MMVGQSDQYDIIFEYIASGLYTGGRSSRRYSLDPVYRVRASPLVLAADHIENPVLVARMQKDALRNAARIVRMPVR